LNNFILTAHLALDVPEGQCWIRVGDDTYYWKNGEVSIFDTSIFHSTWNDADRDRFVLLMRFWHPDLSQDEVKAFS
jgi:aspartate beta-hydroxylase